MTISREPSGDGSGSYSSPRVFIAGPRSSTVHSPFVSGARQMSFPPRPPGRFEPKYSPPSVAGRGNHSAPVELTGAGSRTGTPQLPGRVPLDLPDVEVLPLHAVGGSRGDEPERAAVGGEPGSASNPSAAKPGSGIDQPTAAVRYEDPPALERRRAPDEIEVSGDRIERGMRLELPAETPAGFQGSTVGGRRARREQSQDEPGGDDAGAEDTGRSHLLEVLVDELDGHRAFADGRGDALDRAGPHVARGEDARPARLEQERRPLAASSAASSRASGPVSTNSSLVALDLRRKPVGVGPAPMKLKSAGVWTVRIAPTSLRLRARPRRGGRRRASRTTSVFGSGPRCWASSRCGGRDRLDMFCASESPRNDEVDLARLSDR